VWVSFCFFVRHTVLTRILSSPSKRGRQQGERHGPVAMPPPGIPSFLDMPFTTKVEYEQWIADGAKAENVATWLQTRQEVAEAHARGFRHSGPRGSLTSPCLFNPPFPGNTRIYDYGKQKEVMVQHVKRHANTAVLGLPYTASEDQIVERFEQLELAQGSGGGGSKQPTAAPQEFEMAVRLGAAGVYGLKLKPRIIDLDDKGNPRRKKIVEVTGVDPQCPSFGLLEMGDEIVAVAEVDVRGDYSGLLEELLKHKFEPGGAPCRVLRRAKSGDEQQSRTEADLETARAAYDELMQMFEERRLRMFSGVF
jgi:hypothetical protein